MYARSPAKVKMFTIVRQVCLCMWKTANQITGDWHTWIQQPIFLLKLLKTICSPDSPDYSLNLTEAFVLELCRLRTPLHDTEVRASLPALARLVIWQCINSREIRRNQSQARQGRRWDWMEARVSLMKTKQFFSRLRGDYWRMTKQLIYNCATLWIRVCLSTTVLQMPLCGGRFPG